MAAEAKRLELLKAERAVKEGDAATKVQSRVRGRASREEFTALKEIRDMKVAKEKAAAEKQAAKEALSATKVQSHVRRRASREEFEGLKQIRSEQAAKEGAKKAAAATKVQKHARARASREEFFGLKKIRAARRRPLKARWSRLCWRRRRRLPKRTIGEDRWKRCSVRRTPSP